MYGTGGGIYRAILDEPHCIEAVGVKQYRVTHRVRLNRY
jgi:hypothetical protein